MSYTRVTCALGALGLWMLAAPASAMPIDTGSTDLGVRWDNTLRYNLGVRAQQRDQTLADTWSLQAGEYKFDRGDVVTDRVDLYSELDVNWRKQFGARLSGAGWYDAAYNDKVHGNPAYSSLAPFGLDTAYGGLGDRYSNTVRRYYTHSGELADAFVYDRFDLGSTTFNVKLGRHNLYWGESLFSAIHGVAYSQGPVDFRKGVANPGSEAKELFLPLNRLSVTAQVTDQVSLGLDYALEWQPYRIYEGGTYFTYADPFFQGGTNYLGTPFSGDVNTPKNRGNFGLMLKATPEWLGGSLGVYFRRFDDKVPAVIGTYAASGLVELHNDYARDVRIFGVSLAKSFDGVSIGAELVRRDNTALNTVFGAPGMARGSSWHAILNAIAYIGKTPLFDSAAVTTELQYSRLAHVDADTASDFWHVDHACASPTAQSGGSRRDGCATNDALGFNLLFEPTWFQVSPGLDMSMPFSYARGLYGNSPVPFGGNEASGSWSLGVKGDWRAQYTVALAYTGYFGTYTAGANPLNGAPLPGAGAFPTQVMATSNGGNALIRDRGWVSLTLKTTF
jgi:hypothetical protein